MLFRSNPINFILISVVSIGVPIKILHEGEGHVVTVELKNGETYRGMLTEAEDSMNCQMKEGNSHNLSSLCSIHRQNCLMSMIFAMITLRNFSII